MFDTTRQDDLLNKLKSCVGGLKQETAHQNTLSKQSTSMLKENQFQSKDPFTSNPIVSPHKMQNFGSFGYDRRPMAPIVNEPLTSRRAPVLDYLNEKSKRSSEVILNTKQQYFKKPQQIKLNEELNRHKAGLNSYKNRQVQVAQQPASFRLIQNSSQSQVKKSIARRYSFMNNQKPQASYVPEPGYNYLRQNPMPQRQIQVPKPQPKKYREELEERKNLVNQDYVGLAQKPILSARKEFIAGNIRKQNISLSSQKQTLIQEKTIKNSYQQQLLPKPLQATPMVVNEKPLIRESLRKSVQPQEGECSALAKLKKISELNQKINERIRNIINVFEQK